MCSLAKLSRRKRQPRHTHSNPPLPAASRSNMQSVPQIRCNIQTPLLAYFWDAGRCLGLDKPCGLDWGGAGMRRECVMMGVVHVAG